MQTLTVKTGRRTQLLDVTAQVEKAVSGAKISKGVCYLYVPHTTAGIAINECADPDVARDIEDALDRQIGRASCREKSVDLGGRRIIKKKKKKREKIESKRRKKRRREK